jgi:hypothetical protein
MKLTQTFGRRTLTSRRLRKKGADLRHGNFIFELVTSQMQILSTCTAAFSKYYYTIIVMILFYLRNM